MTSPILKVSVLASGAILIDGQPSTVEGLASILDRLKEERPIVWYYREAAGTEPPPQAMQAMQAIASRRVPVSLCSQPDFSDYVDRKGVSHPREANWESVTAKVRESTAGGKYVGILRPDRTYLLLAPPSRTSVPPPLIQSMEKLVPPEPPRNIAVVADTYFAMKSGGAIPTLQETGAAIPFFGMLLGLACIGHAVYVFGPDAVADACREADMLIVDSAVLPSLAGNWKNAAGAAMRSPNILLHDRESFRLRPV